MRPLNLGTGSLKPDAKRGKVVSIISRRLEKDRE